MDTNAYSFAYDANRLHQYGKVRTSYRLRNVASAYNSYTSKETTARHVGNRLTVTNNGVDTAYWANPLNQYTHIFVDFVPPCGNPRPTTLKAVRQA